MTEEFERCRPWLEAALALDPTDSIEDVRAKVARGELIFMSTERAAGIAAIHTEPQTKDFNVWLAGGDLADLIPLEAKAERLARRFGCSRLTIHGRRGWLRALPGYSELHTAMAKVL